MMKLSLATATIILGTSIPNIYSLGTSGSAFGAVGLQSYHSYPSTTTIRSLPETDVSQDVGEKSLSRRRTELTLSQECIDGTDQIYFEDARYNATFELVSSDCPLRNTNQDGTVTFLFDQRDCVEDSEFFAFCEANYQPIKLPDVKVSCPITEEEPTPRVIYAYGVVECGDPSCPSDPSELSPEDILKILFLRSDPTGCTLEFLEEGEEPQVELSDAIVPDNLSEECIDQVDNSTALFAANEEYVALESNAPVCTQNPTFQWMSGSDTILVFDLSSCDGGEHIAKRRALCDAYPNYQILEFGILKVTCAGLSGDGAGNLVIYNTDYARCVGTSCPANPADWSIPDMKYSDTPGTIDYCEWELVGVEDVPEPPGTAAPAAPDDATAAPENATAATDAPLDASGVDASAAPEDEVSDSLALGDDSSASRFVASMTIALPLAAAFRFLV